MEAPRGTHEHAVVSVFVEEEHPGLWRHSHLLPGQLPIVGVEDGLAAGAALGGGCQVQEQRPSRLARDAAGGLGVDSQGVGVIVYLEVGASVQVRRLEDPAYIKERRWKGGLKCLFIDSLTLSRSRDAV